LDVRLLDVVFVADLSDDLLEHVFDRDEPRRAAVFIAHDGDVRVAGLEVAKLAVDGLGRRDEDRAAYQPEPATFWLRVGNDGREQILGVENPDDIVQRVVVHREARVLGAAHAIEDFRSEEHTSELQSLAYLVCRLLLEKKNTII